jgi:hypothetical protein
MKCVLTQREERVEHNGVCPDPDGRESGTLWVFLDPEGREIGTQWGVS